MCPYHLWLLAADGARQTATVFGRERGIEVMLGRALQRRR